MSFKNFQANAGVRPSCSSKTPTDDGLQEDLCNAGAEASAVSRHVAMVGHENPQVDLLARLLAQQGYQISIMDAWPERLDDVPNIDRIDLIVLDLARFEGDSGNALIARMRTHLTSRLPILVLADELTEAELVRLYEAGADDVMFKPLRVAVFPARLQALARRVYPDIEPSADVLKVGVYTINLAARQLSLNGQLIKLSGREYDLALYLFRNVGRLVSRTTLEKVIWGRELGIDSKTVDTHVYRLRLKLRLQPENGLQLASVYAQGFRLIQVVSLP